MNNECNSLPRERIPLSCDCKAVVTMIAIVIVRVQNILSPSLFQKTLESDPDICMVLIKA